ncbi:MAG: hypothetical protein Q9173_006295 [Seirophora scorigena]
MSSPRASRPPSPKLSSPPTSLDQASSHAPVPPSKPAPCPSSSSSPHLISPRSPSPPSPPSSPPPPPSQARFRLSESSPSPRPPSSPAPMQDIRANPAQHSESIDELLFQANALLSFGNSRQAIQLYTKVLYEKAPGHIVAFLNRSMAYIHQQRPELAAADAYRAAVAINAAMDAEPQKFLPRALETKRYLRLEGLCIQLGRDWTHRDRRYLPAAAGTWVKQPLASLVMDMDEDDCPVWGDLDFEDILPRFELRAVYRLCGALYTCNGGAAQEAAGLIDDIANTHKMYGPEGACFRYLGNAIVQSMTAVIVNSRKDRQETDDEHVVLTTLNGIKIPRLKPEDIFKRRVTMIPALQYWNDPYEPDFRNRYTHRDLSSMVTGASDSCVPIAFDQSGAGLQARIGLHASRDHLPGDHILSDCGSWNVTTDTGKDFMDAWRKGQADYYRLYCDVCATALLLPDALLTYVTGDAFLTGASKVEARRCLEDLDKEILDDEQREKRISWALGTHVTWCTNDHPVIYCCSTCRRKSRVFDAGLHGSKIELTVRSDKIPPTASSLENTYLAHPRSLYAHSKTQTLYDLLFLRIYASALNQDKHPLELVKFLRAGLSQPRARTQNSRTPLVPWSFHNNVVRPIWMINQFHQSLNQDPFRYLRQSDGWVINTLLAKIQGSTTIAAGAFSAIMYKVNEEEKSYYSRGLDPWVRDQGEAVYESDEAFKEVWVARLDPLVSLIRVADEAKDEKPNCWLKYEEGVRVIAGQPDDPPDKQEVAISMGESLLRAKPKFLGGNPNDVISYSQRESAPPIKAVRSESPDRSAYVKDHPMTDVGSETVEPKEADKPAVPETRAASAESMGTDDTEMLDFLDSHSPEEAAAEVVPRSLNVTREAPAAAGKFADVVKKTPTGAAKTSEVIGKAPDATPEVRPSSTPSSPVKSDDVVNLEGHAEEFTKRPKAISSPPARQEDDGDEDDEVQAAWDQDDIFKSRLSFKKRRFSNPVPRDDGWMAQYRAGEVRVRRRFHSPTNSLVTRARMDGVQSMASSGEFLHQPRARSPSPTPRARTPPPAAEEGQRGFFLQQPRATSPSPPLSDESRRGELPFGQMLNSSMQGSMLGEGTEIPVVAEAPRRLEMRSITDIRRGTPGPEHDVEAGKLSSKEKGKTVMRGGDALYFVRDGVTDETVFEWKTEDEESGYWMDMEA